MYMELTTHRERQIVTDTVDHIMDAIDTAVKVLYDLLAEYFTDLQQKAIPDYKAASIGRVLRLATNAIFDSLVDYYATIGDSTWRGAEGTIGGAKHALRTVEAEDLFDKLMQRERAASPEKRKALEAARQALGDLPDKEAILGLRALLNSDT